MNTQKNLSHNTSDNIYQALIKEIRDAAFETGYYQATLEKCELTESERDGYDRLNRAAILRRNNKHGDLLNHIGICYYPRKGATV